MSKWLKEKNYLALYQAYPQPINTMLMIETKEEFEDFLAQEHEIDTQCFWNYHAAAQGDCLMIGGYEGDVTEKVAAFLKSKLPAAAFAEIRSYLQGLHVDINDCDNLQEKLLPCTQRLLAHGYSLVINIDDVYCECAYFLTVKHIA